MTAQKRELEEAFISTALSMRRRGYKHYSADGIGHILRWQSAVREEGPFKINNNNISTLARRAMERCPELSGFFRTRKQGGA